MTDSTPDAWLTADGDPDDVPEARRGRLPPVSEQRPFLREWIEANAHHPAPEHLYGGAHLYPLPVTTPRVLYVWDDADGLDAISVRGCGITGPVTFYPGRGLSHYGVPCGSFADEECGPLRCMRIAQQVNVQWSAVPALHLYRIDASDLDALKREDSTGSKLEKGRVTDAIAERGGGHLSIIVQDGDMFRCYIFSTVDHSTTRRNRGNPPRQVDTLPSANALAYLHALLRGGIVKRSASLSLELDDAQGMGRGTGRGQGVSLGQLGKRLAQQIEPMMRRLYAGVGGTLWPDHESMPLDRNTAAQTQLARDAIDAVKAADRERRAQTGGSP
jgi:hypothetical protein